MEIRDPIHGAILVERHELPVVDSRYFQRLRQIKQLGFAEYSFPSATHNRYIHSMGAMHTATRVVKSIFRNIRPTVKAEAIQRFRAITRLAALLHDVGHGPLSHTTEFAMPPVERLNLSLLGERGRKATHEDYTLKILLDSDLTPALEQAGRAHGFGPLHIACLIHPQLEPQDDFFVTEVDGRRIDFRPVLQQVISSELDADRMDYLLRDSLNAGVSYGNFDSGWLIGNLKAHFLDGKAYLALNHRALYSFEDFLISRFNMFLMVYFHYKSVIFDAMLGEYFESADCDYQLPSAIDDYLACDDSHLISHLARSQNPWAKRITHKKPYRILVEIHSGVPATETAHREQRKLLEEVERNLKDQGIHFLKVNSTGELSKYFRNPGPPFFIQYDNHYSATSMIPVGQCTDLFERFQSKRTITRIYVSPEDYPRCRNQGRNTPLQLN